MRAISSIASSVVMPVSFLLLRIFSSSVRAACAPFPAAQAKYLLYYCKK
jgi:hypothetical protein